MSSFFSLEDQVAVITGGTSGIGLEAAKRFIAAGAKVVISGRKDGTDIASEIGAQFVQCDVSDSGSVDALMGRAQELLGNIDIIVNNAGLPSEAGASPILDTDEDVWNRTMDVNVNGVFLVTKYGGRLMRDCGNGGSIVMIASLAGRVGLPDYGAYCASKFGVVGFTQQLALELAGTGIRANCVSPGSHDTDMMDGTIARATKKHQLPDGAYREQLEDFIPMGRQGHVSELAAAVSFMCSSDASYITGQTLNVDGGARLD